MRDVMIPDALVLADPSDAYIKRIRAGFVLLQAGMAFGLIRGCIALMNQVKGPLGHVNKYLDVQPEHLAEQLGAWRRTVERLAATPFETDPAYWRAVIEARLASAKPSVAAAHAAMLHCGARGYVARPRRSAGCAKPISSPSSRPPSSSSRRCLPTWRTERCRRTHATARAVAAPRR